MSIVVGVTLTSCEKNEDIGIEKRIHEGQCVTSSPSNSFGLCKLMISNGLFYFNYKHYGSYVCPYLGKIVDVGKIDKISSISTIPGSGWVDQCQIIPKHGYVVRWEETNNNYYERIYVKETINDSEGGILGYVIRIADLPF